MATRTQLAATSPRLRLTKPCVGHDEAEAVRRVLESGWLTEGPETRKLEQEVAAYVGAKYAVAVCNGTVALELCLRALHIRGDVLIPAFTHPATAQAVINAGATPILTDVSMRTYNMDMEGFGVAPSIMPVSWAGNPDYTVPYDAQIIEDAACSLGSSMGGEHPRCFSLHPRKVITCGEGGIVTTDDEALSMKLRALKNFGEDPSVLVSQKWDGQYDYLRWCKGQVDVRGHGTNAKLSDIQAAIARVQLRKIETIIAERIEMAQVYDELLADVSTVKSPEAPTHGRHVYQTYAVYLTRGNRDHIIAKLAEQGIETQIGTYALHQLTAFKYLKRLGSLTNAERLYQDLLALPMAHDLTPEDQQYVVDSLAQCLA